MKKRVWALLLALLLLGAAGSALAFPPESEPLLPGIDVSKWQGYIDFDRVKAAGIDVVYIRASYGEAYVDPYFEAHYASARAAGLDVGVYHYLTAGTAAQARAQARFFLNTVAGKTLQCKPAMDYERFSSTAQANAVALAFLQELREQSGMDPVIYTNASHARTVWSQEVADFAPIWVAEYGVSEPADNGKWETWVGFQYTDAGRVDGITGDVDRDWFTQEIYLDQEAAAPTPTPAPEPLPPHVVHITIRVQRGETLWGLARRYDTSVAELVRLNHITNPNRIYVGQELVIPVDR